MRKIFLFLIPVILASIVFGILLFVLSRETGKGALQVTANPKSKVYLNNKLIGQTPLCKCEGKDILAVGEYSLKLVPIASNATSEGGLSPYEEKITIGQSVLTVVDRVFGKGPLSEGKTISLTPLSDKKAIELTVLSFPEDIRVFVDNVEKGSTPTSIKGLTASDHEIKLVKEGYREKSIRIHMVLGYKLQVIANLGITPLVPDSIASPSASPVASVSATIASVTILQTPVGFLRVREKASISSAEIGRVAPGDIVPLMSQVKGWYEVKLTDGKIGWISSQYAKKQ